MLSSPKFKMVAQNIAVNSLELVIPCENSSMEHAFPPESFRREDRATFSKFHLFPGIFQWNARKTCVLLASQPEFLDKWKAPRDSTAELFPQLHWLSLAFSRSHGICTNTVSRRNITSEGNEHCSIRRTSSRVGEDCVTSQKTSEWEALFFYSISYCLC